MTGRNRYQLRFVIVVVSSSLLLFAPRFAGPVKIPHRDSTCVSSHAQSLFQDLRSFADVLAFSFTGASQGHGRGRLFLDTAFQGSHATCVILQSVKLLFVYNPHQYAHYICPRGFSAARFSILATRWLSLRP